MPLEKLKTDLATKIVSREAFDEILCAAGVPREYGPGHPSASRYSVGNILSALNSLFPGNPAIRAACNNYLSWTFGHIPVARWWAMRETARIMVGVYEQMPPEAACGVLGYPMNTFAHPSIGNPTLVAYTPSVEDGERDKQRIVTLSKYLRGYNLLMLDSDMRDHEASYRGVMSDELLLLTGEDIVKAFVLGPTSCMSYPASYWKDSLSGRHPAEVYDMPGFAVAVTQSSDRYSGRALTWTNPEDPEDKRYVRHYGDPALIRRLQKHGFKPGSLAGAKLKRIHIQGDRYLMPYLDSTGGPNQGEGIVLKNDALLVVDKRTRLALEKHPGFVGRIKSTVGTGGSVEIIESAGDLTTWTCAITGETFDMMDSRSPESVPVMINGVEGMAQVSAVHREGFGAVFVSPDRVQVYMPADAPGLFSTGGGRAVDNEVNRAHFGYTRLSPTYYPDATWCSSWDGEDAVTAVHLDDTLIALIANHDVDGTPLVEHRIKKSDAAQVILRTPDPEHPFNVFVHRSLITPEGWVRTARIIADVPCYAHKDVPVVKTSTGRNGVVGAHPIVLTWEGKYEATRNVLESRRYGARVYAHKNGPRAPSNPTLTPEVKRALDAMVARALRDVAADAAPARGRVVCAALLATRFFASLASGYRLQDGRLTLANSPTQGCSWGTDPHPQAAAWWHETVGFANFIDGLAESPGNAPDMTIDFADARRYAAAVKYLDAAFSPSLDARFPPELVTEGESEEDAIVSV